MKISDAIRALRKQTGQTQQQLANSLGLAVSSVARYEAGKQPEARILAQLAQTARDTSRDDLAIVFDAELKKGLQIRDLHDLGLMAYLLKLILLLREQNLRLFEKDLSYEDRVEIAEGIADISKAATTAIQDSHLRGGRTP